jgi:hypothetical protein
MIPYSNSCNNGYVIIFTLSIIAHCEKVLTATRINHFMNSFFPLNNEDGSSTQTDDPRHKPSPDKGSHSLTARYFTDALLGLIVAIAGSIIYDSAKVAIQQPPARWILIGLLIACVFIVQIILLRNASRKLVTEITHQHEREAQHLSDLLHKFVHRARDLGVKLMPHNEKPEAIPSEALRKADEERLQKLMTTLQHIFETRVPKGTKVWVALRTRANDKKFHTFMRTANCDVRRENRSEPLGPDANVIKALKESYHPDRQKPDCVLLTGSACPDWQKMKNDHLGEDKSVLMGAVFSKTWNGKSFDEPPVLTWILFVNADKEGAFNESDKPLMRCCNDVFSWLLNEFVRFPME